MPRSLARGCCRRPRSRSRTSSGVGACGGSRLRRSQTRSGCGALSRTGMPNEPLDSDPHAPLRRERRAAPLGQFDRPRRRGRVDRAHGRRSRRRSARRGAPRGARSRPGGSSRRTVRRVIRVVVLMAASSVRSGCHFGRMDSVVGPTETTVIGRSGQRSRTRRMSARVTREKASSSLGDRQVLAAIGPVEAERGEPAHRPLAAEDGAGEDLVLGLGQLLVGEPLGHDAPVDLGDPAEVGLGLVGLAAQEGEEGARLVVVLVRDARRRRRGRGRPGPSRAASRCGRRGRSPGAARRSGRRSPAAGRRRRRSRSAAGPRRGGSPGTPRCPAAGRPGATPRRLPSRRSAPWPGRRPGPSRSCPRRPARCSPGCTGGRSSRASGRPSGP